MRRGGARPRDGRRWACTPARASPAVEARGRRQSSSRSASGGELRGVAQCLHHGRPPRRRRCARPAGAAPARAGPHPAAAVGVDVRVVVGGVEVPASRAASGGWSTCAWRPPVGVVSGWFLDTTLPTRGRYRQAPQGWHRRHLGCGVRTSGGLPVAPPARHRRTNAPDAGDRGGVRPSRSPRRRRDDASTFAAARRTSGGEGAEAPCADDVGVARPRRRAGRRHSWWRARLRAEMLDGLRWCWCMGSARPLRCGPACGSSCTPRASPTW